jgi:hypothetical protein
MSAGLSLIGPSLYQDRYVVFSHPCILITCAAALWLFISKHKRLHTPIAAALIIFFAATTINSWHQLKINQKPGLAAAASHVAANISPGDGLLVNSPFIFFAADYYASDEFPSPVRPRLYTEGSLSHFAGGPVITTQDIAGQAFWRDFKGNNIWIIDTTGFGASPIMPPQSWQVESRASYQEVFGYQGDIKATHYTRVR